MKAYRRCWGGVLPAEVLFVVLAAYSVPGRAVTVIVPLPGLVGDIPTVVEGAAVWKEADCDTGVYFQSISEVRNGAGITSRFT